METPDMQSYVFAYILHCFFVLFFYEYMLLNLLLAPS